MSKPYVTLQEKLFPTSGNTSDAGSYLELLLKVMDNLDTSDTSFTNDAAEFLRRLTAIAPGHPAVAKIKSLLGKAAD